MRLASVPYLNAIPLTHGLPQPIWKATPRVLLRSPEKWDVALLSTVALFQHPDWRFVPGVAIGSMGAVQSVKLFFKHEGFTVQNIKKIYLDVESNTAIALLKILLQFYWKRSLNTISWNDQQNETVDASLFIGDKALQNQNAPAIDLGEVWTTWTGLPFVYALWIAQKKEWIAPAYDLLIPIAQKNLQQLAMLAKEFAPAQPDALQSYWENLCYQWGPEQVKGLALFRKYYAELNSIRRPSAT